MPTYLERSPVALCQQAVCDEKDGDDFVMIVDVFVMSTCVFLIYRSENQIHWLW